MRRKKTTKLKKLRLQKSKNDKNDCKIVEQTQDVIIIDDDESRDVELNVTNNSINTTTLTEEETATSLFYEDRNPGSCTDYSVPLYSNQTHCQILNNAVSGSKVNNTKMNTLHLVNRVPAFSVIFGKDFTSHENKTSTPWKKSIASSSSSSKEPSANDKSNHKEIAGNVVPTMEMKSDALLDSIHNIKTTNPSNVQITIKAIEDNAAITTRSCTITSNSIIYAKPTSEPNTLGINENDDNQNIIKNIAEERTVSTSILKDTTQSNQNNLQVTIPNKNSPEKSTSKCPKDAISINDSDDVIWVDSTMDDSVVFVSESLQRDSMKDTRKRKFNCSDFISIANNQQPAKVSFSYKQSVP